MREHLAVIETVEGPIVDLGFGNGAYSNKLKQLMKDPIFSKRDFYLFDWFKERPVGRAIDFANSITNELGKEGQLIRGDVRETVPSKLPEKIALLNVDLQSLELTTFCLESAYERVVNGGLIVVHHQSGGDELSYKALELFRLGTLSQKHSEKVVRKNNSSYIIKKRIRVIPNGKVTRKERPEHLR